MFGKSHAIRLKTFMADLEGPVCIISHNGDRFDFPLLVAEMRDAGKRFSENLYCADSLIGIR